MTEKIIGKGTLKKDNWGRYISLKESGIELDGIRDDARLSHSGNHENFKVGEKYDFQIFFQLQYPKKPEKGCMEWTEISGNSLETVLKHPNYDQAIELCERFDTLSRIASKKRSPLERIVPYIKITNN